MLVRLSVIICCFCVAPAFGQTLSEINLKYGNPTNAYSVSQHIWMTPEFTGDGQVCRMRLYPKHIDLKTDYLSPQLYFEELSAVLNDLVPLELRGQKQDSFGLTDFGGGSAWTTYSYEKVSFIFAFSFRISPGFKGRPEPITLPVGEVLARLPKKTRPSIDDFAPSKSTKIEIATILWNNRKCAP